MKLLIMLIPILVAISSCSRPETPPPVTPAQPPTVESKLEADTIDK